MKSPEHAPVDSSTIRSIGYNKESGDLHVAFRTGGNYVYQNVPPHVYEGLMQSGSKGQYLHHHVKSKHEFNKL